MTEIKKTPSQEAAIDSRGENIIVSAAAGSGKTFVLVERVISLMLEEGVDIDKMIIVTFTNKAAADMKAKLRDRLEERKDDFDYTFYKRQLKLINKAQIKTLHSFCADMIRENFYYFDNLSPNFKVMTDSTNTILKMETLDEIFDKEYEKMDENFRVFLQNFGTNRDDGPAKSVIVDTYEKIIGQVDPLGWLSDKTYKENTLEKLKEITQKSLEKLLDLSFRLTVYVNERDMREKHQELVTEDYQIIKNLYDSMNPWDDFIKTTDRVKFPRLTYSKKDDQEAYNKLKTTRNFYKARVDELADLVRNSEEGLVELTSKKEKALLLEIKRLTEKFLKLFNKKKRDRSYLDFSDMEHFFIKLLDDDTARTKLRENFAYIFFDEYQDSNEVQNYIIERLKKDDNLFFVGDVKQSIYGFRRARPDLFLEKLDSYEKDEDSRRIDLNENFRTDKLILDFNNYIFDRIMTKEVSDIDYKFGGHRLNFGKEEENPRSKVGLKVLDKKVPEEDYLVKLINKLVAEEGYDYRDIAILLRSGNRSYAYERSLKMAGIPYFNDISKVSFRAAEVGFFINLLRFLAYPNDDITLLSVLRSEIFNFSEDDLAAIKLNSKSYRFYEGFNDYGKDDEIKDKIDSFKKVIGDLKDKLAILNLYDFSNYLFEKTGLYDFLLARDLSEDRINNIESLIDLMAEYDLANDNGLYGFLNFYENISKNQKDTIDQSRDLSEDENLIRIMTIHKSKGLEFKVVILADSTRTIRDMHSRNNIVFDDDLGIGIDIANYEQKVKLSSLNKKLIVNKLKQEDKKEEMRILYVALTRAEEGLYITGTKALKPIKKLYQNTDYLSMSSHFDWLMSSLSFDKLTEEIFEKDYLTDEFSSRVSVEYIDEIGEIEQRDLRDLDDILKAKPDSDKVKVFESYLDFAYEGADDIGKSLKKSVTEIAKNFDRQNEGYEISSFGEGYDEDIKKPDFLVEDRAYSPLERGTLIHKVFERLPLKSYDEDLIKDEIGKLAKCNIIGKDSISELEADKFLAFYQNPLIKKFIEKNTDFRKEESFLMAYEDFYVNGQIDLIFEEDDGIILIDFKTDRKKRDYSAQLKIYAQAIEEALAKPVKKKLVYWYNFKEFEEM